MHADKNLPLNEITERILGCGSEVANCLGSGFLEKVYENAVAHELRKAGLLNFGSPRLEIKRLVNRF